MCQRKTRTVPPSLPSSAFSPVQVDEQISRKMGKFRVFRSKGRRNFCAVETPWWRGLDSNLRYGLNAIRLVPISLASSKMPQGSCGSLRSATGNAQSLTRAIPSTLVEEFTRSVLPRIRPLCHPQSSRSLGECLPVQAVYGCHHPEP